MDQALILRALERCFGIAVGGVAIFLGYRLFLLIPDKTDSEGKVVLPGNVSILMSRVGPGVFFALFGSAIVSIAFYQTLSYSSPQPQHAGTTQGKDTGATLKDEIRYVSSPEANPTAILDTDEQIRQELRFLNVTLQRMLRSDLSDPDRATVEEHTDRLKTVVIAAAWDVSWGRYTEFANWVYGGSRGELPSSFEPAIKLFKFGLAGD